jgi:predicted RNA-binding Zn ribbon-like protein
MVSKDVPEFEPVETMDLTGGDVSLDFVNTASGRAVGPVRDKLGTYVDLVTWGERVGVVDDQAAERLRGAVDRSPSAGDLVLDRARALREATYRLFTAEQADSADLELLSGEAGRAAAKRRLAPVADGYGYVWPDDDSLDRVLWPVAVAAAELLTSPDRERVKECGAHDCSWLFLDMSRNRSRRWCDMRVCGNRAKARRFSARQRSR